MSDEEKSLEAQAYENVIKDKNPERISISDLNSSIQHELYKIIVKKQQAVEE